jgi:putative peptidoglycan lipid II flippase
MSFARAVTTVAGLTMVSRVLGFVREMLVAGLLGATPIADAFFMALTLPNVFRRLFAEGAFSAAFVPLFTKTMKNDGKPAAAQFAEEAQAIMLLILVPLTAVLWLVMPYVMLVLAPGFERGSERYDLAVTFCRITFPYLVFISITTLQGGVLNALDRYGPFAFAYTLFNICLIGGLLLTPLFPTAGHAAAWGEFASGIIQVLWMIGSCRRAGIFLKPRWPRVTPAIKRLFALMAPTAVGAGASQINIYIDGIVASLLPTGAIAHLNYAARLYQLPLGVIGVAVGTALLPALARHVASNDREGAKRLESRAFEAAMLLALPAAVALFVARQPFMIGLFVYPHGAFHIADAIASGEALAAYAAGIPAYVLAKVLSTAYFAREDTRTPLKFSLIAITLNTALVLALVLVFHMGIVGIAAATGITAWLNVGLLALGLHRRGLLGFDVRLRQVFPRILLANLAMAAVLWAIQVPFESWWSESGLVHRIVSLSVLIGGGMGVYGLTIVLTKVAKPGDIAGMLRRERSSALTAPKGKTDNPIPPETLSSST